MKTKLAIIAILGIFTFKAQAQTEKGDFLLGGSVTYFTQKNGTQPRSNNFGITPKFGYFINKNFALGAQLLYNYNKRDGFLILDEYYTGNLLQGGDNSQSYGISPFTRYYVDLSDHFKFFGELALSVATGKSKNVDENGKSTITNYHFNKYGAGISPGLAFFPTKKWAVEFAFPLLTYTKQTYSKIASPNSVRNNDNFGFGLNTFSPAIGVNYHF